MSVGRSSKRSAFPEAVARPAKRAAGVTGASETPLAVRTSGVTLKPDQRAYIASRLGSKIGKFALHIERTTVRLSDDNGPRGGIDVVCAIKVVLRGLDTVLYDATGSEVREAFDLAADGISRAVKRAIGKAGRTAPKSKAVKSEKKPVPAKRTGAKTAKSAAGSLIGRRVGRGPAQKEAVLERPEKRKRNAVVDTAAKGVSATDRKAGGTSTARRNAKKNPKGVAILEDSQTGKPSRRSTRKGNGKAATQLELKASRASRTPTARARRAKAKG